MVFGQRQNKLIFYFNIIFQEIEEALAKESAARKEMEANNAKLLEEKNQLFVQLENAKSGGSELEDKLNKLNTQKSECDKQISVSSLKY